MTPPRTTGGSCPCSREPKSRRSEDQGARHGALRLLRAAGIVVAVVGPATLGMLGENDGPSMLSYAATGTSYGVGFFLPFVVLTFAAAVFVQILALRVGAVTRLGFSELIFRRFGSFWGWVTCADLVFVNVVTLITEVVAIRVGLAYFSVPGWVAVVAAVALVAVTSMTPGFVLWERLALGLGVFNLVFVPAAILSHPQGGAIATAFATWRPLPSGGSSTVLLLLASDAGATLTPWMLFFESNASGDERADLTAGAQSRPRVDAILGGCLGAAAACATMVACAPLFLHHRTVQGQGGAAYAQALEPFLGRVGASLFAVGLIEAGALAMLTISASTAYVIGGKTGGDSGFSAPLRQSMTFRVAAVAVAAAGALVTLIPGAPLLSIVLNSNIIAAALIPPALVFLLLLVTDREVMGERTTGRVGVGVGTLLTAAIFVAVASYVGSAFVKSL